MEEVKNKLKEILENTKMSINDKVSGLHFLEQYEYLILQEIKEIEINFFINYLNNTDKNEITPIDLDIKDNPIISNLKSYKESVSKIKSTYAEDTLSIVIEGFIKISLSDSQNAKKVTSLSLPKNTGIVLSKNSITSEKIGSSSIILDIILKKNIFNIEK